MVAQLLRNNAVVHEVELPFAGTVSTYTGRLKAPTPGTYTVQVLAMDPGHQNFGWIHREVHVR